MAPQNTLAMRSDTEVAKRHSFGAESMSTADSDDQEVAVANRRKAAQASTLGFKLNKTAQHHYPIINSNTISKLLELQLSATRIEKTPKNLLFSVS